VGKLGFVRVLEHADAIELAKAHELTQLLELLVRLAGVATMNAVRKNRFGCARATQHELT